MAKKKGATLPLSYDGFRVVPDSLDLRDRMYSPSIEGAPPQMVDTFAELSKGGAPPKIRNQGRTRACTGFALAGVIETLLLKAGKAAVTANVSAMMLYSMAQKYDEFRGDSMAQGDTGSSIRGAMKGWHRHGAASAALWPDSLVPGVMPKASANPAHDWWAEAVKRPLGAYYRIDYRSVTDMHVAIRDTGALLGSARTHDGWLSPQGSGGLPVIESQPGREDWGHAFAIVGYNADGFIIVNSYGKRWGQNGRAVLRYEDWTQNAMDCWVAQLGVVTSQHRAIAESKTLRTLPRSPKASAAKPKAGALQVVLSSDPKLAEHEISPFVIDMANNGELSSSGRFRTSRGDIEDLLGRHLPLFKEAWKVTGNQKVKIGIYAHGGLVGEDPAAAAAREWIPAMYEQKIFPIFLMWETDVFSTLKNRLSDLVSQFLETTGRAGSSIVTGVENWWDQRIEQTVARPGLFLWNEIKQNGEAISTHAGRQGGAQILYDVGKKLKALTPANATIHLIGHSAGSIVHAHIIDELVKAAWTVRSMHFMAPALTLADFNKFITPCLRSRQIGEYHQYHLNDDVEQKDPTCRAVLGYRKSLLYLVSNACEGKRDTPILGMDKYVRDPAFSDLFAGRATFYRSPGPQSRSMTHGGFDDDVTTRQHILRTIASM